MPWYLAKQLSQTEGGGVYAHAAALLSVCTGLPLRLHLIYQNKGQLPVLFQWWPESVYLFTLTPL